MKLTTQIKHKTTAIAESITPVGGGYPNKLVIYKSNASPFWWVRYFAGKIIRRSTKTTHKSEAKKFAANLYEEILLRQRNLLPISENPSFERVAEMLINEQQILIDRGERNERLNLNDSQKLKKDIIPFFKGFDVKNITYNHINKYLTHIAQRDLKPATLKIHLNVIHKILSLAQREGLLERIPQMPKVKMKDSPRGWFSEKEYILLKKTTAEAIKDGVIVRYHPITDELRYLITFAVNTFLRPSDIKLLRHRNIEITENEEGKYLRIQTEESKTRNSPVVSMQAAVGIYIDLIKFHKEHKNPSNNDDYVFFPNLKNRAFALQTMRRQFDEILSRCNLKVAPTGEPRTLYSLRHTAIMFRLTMGDKIDSLLLARNARTSVEMIDRFYAKPLQAEMNVAKIQSMRKRKTSSTEQ